MPLGNEHYLPAAWILFCFIRFILHFIISIIPPHTIEPPSTSYVLSAPVVPKQYITPQLHDTHETTPTLTLHNALPTTHTPHYSTYHTSPPMNPHHLHSTRHTPPCLNHLCPRYNTYSAITRKTSDSSTTIGQDYWWRSRW